jgi:hypothetical protein
MLALERRFRNLNVAVALGYRIDLKLPANGREFFWHRHRQLHALLPIRFAQATAPKKAQEEFYDLATQFLAETDQFGGSLIELIALQESRDELEILIKE